MSIRERETKKGTVYYVETKGVWERVGSDKREALRVNERRKKEVKAGTYQAKVTGGVTVKKYFSGWLDSRKNRSAHLDEIHMRHVLAREWFADLKMEDVRPPLVQRLVDEIKAGPPKLSPKYITNIYGSLHAGFRAAIRGEVIDRDPCLLEPKTLSKKTKEKIPYSLADARQLLASLTGDRLVWVGLALYTGMRCGEVCGRRWSDWDRESLPLGALTIKTQYNDEPLKTDTEEGDKPRRAPVHPELAALLTWWWETGYELVYLQKPTPDGFIVPRQSDATEALSRTITYKALVADCARAGVTGRGQHATRHTFLTQAQRGGAHKDVIEKVTHNAKGDMVDQYTHWEWAPLCEAVLCLPSLLSSKSEIRTEIMSRGIDNLGSDSRTRKEGPSGVGAKTSNTSKRASTADPHKPAGIRKVAAKPGAVSETEYSEEDFRETMAEHAERSLRGRP